MELLHKSSFGQVSRNASSNQVIVGHSSAGNIHQFMHNCGLISWIIDSGDSEHICSSIKWFHSYREIIHIHVRFPNGKWLVAEYSGTINFSHEFTLYVVLLILEFSLNLLYVLKLCEFSNCSVKFLDSKHVIHDKTSMKMTGSAEKKDELYYLTLKYNDLHVNFAHTHTHTSFNNQCIFMW